MTKFETVLDWDGDTEPILLAGRAAFDVLIAEGRSDCRVHLFAEYPTLPPPGTNRRHGYDSFDAATTAIRAAGETPSWLSCSLHLDNPSLAFDVGPCLVSDEYDADEEHGLIVSVWSDRGTRLAQRLHDVAAQAVRTPGGALAVPGTTVTTSRPRGGALGWIEEHPALISLVGIIVAAVVAVALALA